MFFVIATGLVLGLGLGSMFRVFVLIPAQLIIGASVVTGTLSHAITLQQGFSGFAAASVALQLGYLASAAMPLRAQAANRAIRPSLDPRSEG